MADSLNTIPVPKFDHESAVNELYRASCLLTLFAEDLFPNGSKRENGFRVFHLNDQQYIALFYLLYAVSGHVHHLRESLGFGETPKAQS